MDLSGPKWTYYGPTKDRNGPNGPVDLQVTGGPSV